MTTSNILSQLGSAGVSTGFKNRLINGWMAINQRSTSLSTNNSQGYYIDRMWGFSGSGTAATFSQISSTGLAGFPYAARAQRNSGSTGTAGVYTGQIIESINLQDLQGKSVTVSFWARAGANYSAASNILTIYLNTGTVADQGLTQLIAGWTGSVSQTSNITLTTSWQFFSATFTVASTAQEITPFLYNATSGTAGTNDYFDFTGFQLEVGTTATNFDYRPYGTELALCQRYYQTGYFTIRAYSTTNGTNWSANYPPIVTMRTTPTIAISGGSTASINSSGAQSIQTDGSFRGEIQSNGGGDSYAINQICTRASEL